MDFKALEKQKTGPHQILKAIKYRSKLEGARLVKPDPDTDWAKAGVTFEHLDTADYAMLIKTRRIAPVTAVTGKGDKA